MDIDVYIRYVSVRTFIISLPPPPITPHICMHTNIGKPKPTIQIPPDYLFRSIVQTLLYVDYYVQSCSCSLLVLTRY